MDTLLQDLRFGLRALRKTPLLTAVALAALALGTGANTAIFTVVNGVLLRPLAFGEPDRLALAFETNAGKGWDSFAVSPANYLDWRAQARSFEKMAAARSTTLALTGRGEPERLPALAASADFFAVLGVPPLLGRGFVEEEDRPDSGRVVVLTHGLWQRRFGSDPDLVGQVLTLGGVPHTVVGVMPESFRFTGAEIYVPLALTADQSQQRGSHWLFVVARRAPGVTLEAARAELSAIAARLAAAHPDTNSGWGARLDDMTEQAVGGIRPALLLLMAAVGFVLLIACANVANLLLARGAGRRAEIAIRTALGAGRGRIVRQLLVESLLLSLAGAGLGVGLAAWGVQVLLGFATGTLPRARNVTFDGTVLLFTIAVALVSTILFGLAPALRLTRASVGQGLKESGRTGDSGGRRVLGSSLIVVEMALSVVLLIGAGLLLKSFYRLASTPTGFEPGGVLALELSLPDSKYGESAQQAGFYRQALERLAALPGVQRVAAATHAPLAGGDLIYAFFLENAPPDPGQAPSANYAAVSAGYFSALGIPLRQGRAFTEQDDASSPPVAIVDEGFVQRFLGGGDPIGRRFALGNATNEVREIVGVVGSVHHYDLQDARPAMMYVPHEQAPSPFMTLLLKTAGDPAALAPAARATVLGIDPDQPVGQVRTMAAVVAASVAPNRLPAVLLGVFAGLALVLASVGLYGVLSYSVTQRTHEIGVRLALGAASGDLLRLIVGQGMRLALAGVAVGLLAALPLTRLIAGLLYGVSPADPAVFAGLALFLSAVALLACWLPARRAARIPPMMALRNE